MQKKHHPAQLSSEEKTEISQLLNNYKKNPDPKKADYKALRSAIHKHRSDKEPTWLNHLKRVATILQIQVDVQDMIDKPKYLSHSRETSPVAPREMQKSIAPSNFDTQTSDTEDAEEISTRSAIKWGLGTLLVVGFVSTMMASATVALMTTLAAGILAYLLIQKLNTFADNAFSKTQTMGSAAATAPAPGCCKNHPPFKPVPVSGNQPSSENNQPQP